MKRHLSTDGVGHVTLTSESSVERRHEKASLEHTQRECVVGMKSARVSEFDAHSDESVAVLAFRIP